MQDTSARPLRVLQFQLSRKDAHAFASLGRELRGSEKFQMLVVIGLVGLPIGLLPDDMSSPLWWSIAVATIVAGGALALVWLRVLVRRDGSAIPVPDGPVTLEQFPDRLVETSALGTRTFAMTDIAQVIATDTHLFVRTTQRPLIVPSAAFADRADLDRFAAWLDEESDRSQP
ncbi:MAG: hypothetical protein WBF87_03300 [Mesorhizobium sp.]